MRLRFLSFIFMNFCFLLSPVIAEIKTSSLNGVWFICEYSIGNSPPDDNCSMLDNDGFLVESGTISHLKVKNSTQEGCRGNRDGHCFKKETRGLIAKKREIGSFNIGSNWVEVEYLSCSQRYWFKEKKNYWHAWPDEEKCFWTRDKEFYVKNYRGNLIID